MRRKAATEDGSVSLSFSASLHYVRAVRHFLTTLCELAEYRQEECEPIALVVTELLNNAIEHGAAGPADEIEVKLVVRPEIFRFEVQDPGRGGREFARRAEEAANRRPDLEDPRGRGLFLIRSYMDSVQVTHGRDGTRVVVWKRRPR